jgi:hypothetical protein
VKVVEKVLEKRGEKYGKYSDLAELLDKVLKAYESSRNWRNLDPYMRVSLFMDAMKTVRILNGDCREMDSWLDKQGYIQLVIMELEGEQNDEQSTPEHRRPDRKT